MPLAWPIIKDLLVLRDRLNGWFEGAYLEESPGVGEPSSGPFCPAADLYETDQAVVVILEVPGVEAQSIEVKLQGAALRVSGRIPPAHGDGQSRFVRMERASGAFFRDFQLPVDRFDGDPSARLERGVLTIHLAKPEELRRRQIDIVREGE
jgi:HSP20 family protein